MADSKKAFPGKLSPAASPAVDEDEELVALRTSFEKLAQRATRENGSQDLRSPASFLPYYNSFATLVMELDRRLGTKQLLAIHGDTIKAVRAALKKQPPKSTLLDKVSMPLRFVAFFTVMLVSCAEIVLLIPVVMPIEWALKLLRLRGYSPFNFLGYLLTRCVIAAMGIHVHVEPASAKLPKMPASKGAIVTYNHSANIDPFATYLGTPAEGTCCFLGKKTLFLLPFMGWAMLCVGNIPINRSGKSKAQQMLMDASQDAIVAKKCAVVIAPEGTRSWDGHLSIPMKKGTFHIQKATHAPILPVVLFGAYDLWPRGTFFTRTGEITLRRLQTIPFNDAHSHDEVRISLQRQYLDALYPTTADAIKALPTYRALSFVSALKYVRRTTTILHFSAAGHE